MLDNWLPFLIYAIFALAIPASMMFASFAFSTRPHRRVRARTIPFESGVSAGPPQTQHAFEFRYNIPARLPDAPECDATFLQEIVNAPVRFRFASAIIQITTFRPIKQTETGPDHQII